MNVLRMIPIAMAVIVAMATVASSAIKVTTLKATPRELVLLMHWGNEAATKEDLLEAKNLGAKHCKKYGKVAGHTSFSFNMGAPSGVITIQCVANPQAVNMQRKETSTDSPKIPQKKKRSRLLKSWE